MSLSAKEEMELLHLLEIEERYQAANNYYAYVKYTHGNMYTYTRHGEHIANTLDHAINQRKRMLAGEIPIKTQYIMLSVPPQHGKSMHVTETLPSYFLGHFPDEGVIEISYNSDFAEKFGGRNKDKVILYGKELFDIEVAKDSQSKGEWSIVKDGKKTRGGMMSRGVMSGVTGSSWGDLIIIDDPIKNREEANSETYRDKLWQEWQDSISTRIHPGAIVILINTRWHEDDLWGRLLDPEYGRPLPWKVINLPLECDETHIKQEGNPLNRELGEPLWPERYGYEFIEERKTYPSSYNALYQGRPTSEEGNILKRDWWKYYDVIPADLNSMLISVDAAFKDEDDSDYVVCQVWGRYGPNVYLVDQVRARMNFPATLQTIRNLVNKYPRAALKLIEDKANGSAIIQTLVREIPGIIAVNPEGGKVARVNAVSAFIEAGNVHLPRTDWVHDFVEEAASFPNGKNDDQVDAMSQALHRYYYMSGSMPRDDEPKTRDERAWENLRKIEKQIRNKRKGSVYIG